MADGLGGRTGGIARGTGGRAGPAGPRGGAGRERAQDWPGRSALVGSPDGLGWPGEPAGVALRAARDESGLTAVGLGWPGGTADDEAVPGSGHQTARGGPGTPGS